MSTYAAIRLVLPFDLSIIAPSRDVACVVSTRCPLWKDRRKEEDRPCEVEPPQAVVEHEASLWRRT